jgi:hypothetical protein
MMCPDQDALNFRPIRSTNTTAHRQAQNRHSVRVGYTPEPEYRKYAMPEYFWHTLAIAILCGSVRYGCSKKNVE